jgi:hypothetical protein
MMTPFVKIIFPLHKKFHSSFYFIMSFSTQMFVVDLKVICYLCFDVLIHSHQVFVRVMKINEYTQILEGLVVNEIVVVPIERCWEQSSVNECAQKHCVSTLSCHFLLMMQ